MGRLSGCLFVLGALEKSDLAVCAPRPSRLDHAHHCLLDDGNGPRGSIYRLYRWLGLPPDWPEILRKMRCPRDWLSKPHWAVATSSTTSAFDGERLTRSAAFFFTRAADWRLRCGAAAHLRAPAEVTRLVAGKLRQQQRPCAQPIVQGCWCYPTVVPASTKPCSWLADVFRDPGPSVGQAKKAVASCSTAVEDDRDAIGARLP